MSDKIDIDVLVGELEAGAGKAQELSEALHAEPNLEKGSGDRLIQDIAVNLATMREAVGLSPADPEHFEKRIKRRQHED